MALTNNVSCDDPPSPKYPLLIDREEEQEFNKESVHKITNATVIDFML